MFFRQVVVVHLRGSLLVETILGHGAFIVVAMMVMVVSERASIDVVW